jgi:hypothetical protein
MSPLLAYLKCKNQKKRIPELEDVIVTDPFCSYCYTRDVIKGIWEKGEKIISTDSKSSYWYAKDVLKGRFIEGEKIITTNPHYSYWYAKNIINHPFLLCHPIIFNSEWKNKYIDFLKSINYDLSEISEWLI